MARGHARLRLALLVGTLVLALFPNMGAPATASPRASGRIVASEVTRPWPTHDGRGLTTDRGAHIAVADAGSTGGATLLYTSDTIDAGQVFGYVGVHWVAARGAESSLSVELRTSPDGAAWTPWETVKEEEDMTNEATNEHYGAPLETAPSRYAQYRVWLTNGYPDAVARVSLTFMDVNDLGASPLARLFNDIAGAFADFTRAHTAQAAAGATRILTRQDWAADESLMQWPPKYVDAKKFVIHHTVTSDGGADVAAAIRSIYYYHAVTRGWGDIGYNYLVDKNGNIWTGRQGGDNVVGGHAYGWNDGSIGIAAIGDYSVAQPTSALQGAIANIIAMKGTQLGIQPYGADSFTHQEQAPDGSWIKVTGNPPNVLGHRDCNYILGEHGGQTSCPGNGIYKMLDGLRRLAQNAVNLGYTDMPYLAPRLPHAAFPGATLQVPVVVSNKGQTPIPAGTRVSYQILRDGRVVVPQGGVAALPAQIASGQAASVTVPVGVPALGSYIVRWDLQTPAGQWWGPAKGTPIRDQWFTAADWSVNWVRDDVPISWVAGQTRVVNVTLENDGGRTWPATGTNPVRLGYKWVSRATGNTFPSPTRMNLPADVPPGQSVTLTFAVTAPVYPTNYTLVIDLYKENEFAFADKGIAPDDTPTGVSVDFKAAYTLPGALSLAAGQTTTLPVTVRNTGTGTFPVTSSYPITLGYHWYSPSGQTVVWDSPRTKLPADLPAGQSVTLPAQVTAPPSGGSFQLRVDLVQEGVAWFSAKGVATGNLAVNVAGPVEKVYGATYQPQITTLALPGAAATVPITVKNTGNFTWPSAGANPVDLSYHWLDSSGRMVVWDGLRTKLPADLAPGQSANLQAAIQFPSATGSYTLRWDLVEEGVSWFSGKGVAGFDQPVSLSSATPEYGGSLVVAATPPAMAPARAATFDVTVQNLSSFDWGAGINLSYHWYDAAGALVAWDGARTPLAGIRVNEVRTVGATVVPPSAPGTYTLRYDIVQEGVAWFSSKGMQTPTRTVQVAASVYGATYAPATTAVSGPANTFVYVPVTVTNAGALTWQPGTVNLAYHLIAESGNVYVWDGKRTALGAPLAQGQTATLNLGVLLPPRAGTFQIRIDLVEEGVTWFSGQGVAPGSITLTVQ